MCPRGPDVRRAIAILLVLAALVAVLATGLGAGGDDGNYEVRAIFDNAAFLVKGEQVRIAGATVGTVSDVEVSTPDEVVHEDGKAEPGKAVVVLQIDTAAFQDFRQDASCLIRPQSLLGEKYVECEPTQPRAADSPVPPPLDVIADDQPGAGQRLLPLEQNGKAVDLDLVNNIMREPYADRFRLILNELGAGLAARGHELAQVVDRADPALRETNEVLAILARQNKALAELARNGDAVLAPLARDRERIKGFINSATVTNQATAERAADLETGLARLPQTLREVRATTTELKRFSAAGTPLLQNLAAAAPAATRATKALGPFADAATPAVVSLGEAAAKSKAPLVGSDPLIRQIRKLAKSAAPATQNLSAFLSSLDERGGFKNLLRFAYRGVGSFNGFDNLGHYARAFLLITNCNDYVTAPQSGCIANFLPPTTDETTAKTEKPQRKAKPANRHGGGARKPSGHRGGGVESQPSPASPGTTTTPTTPDQSGGFSAPPLQTEPGPSGTTTTPTTPQAPSAPNLGATPQAQSASQAQSTPQKQMRDAQLLLDFLIGERHEPGKGKKR